MRVVQPLLIQIGVNRGEGSIMHIPMSESGRRRGRASTWARIRGKRGVEKKRNDEEGRLCRKQIIQRGERVYPSAGNE